MNKQKLEIPYKLTINKIEKIKSISKKKLKMELKEKNEIRLIYEREIELDYNNIYKSVELNQNSILKNVNFEKSDYISFPNLSFFPNLSMIIYKNDILNSKTEINDFLTLFDYLFLEEDIIFHVIKQVLIHFLNNILLNSNPNSRIKLISNWLVVTIIYMTGLDSYYVIDLKMNYSIFIQASNEELVKELAERYKYELQMRIIGEIEKFYDNGEVSIGNDENEENKENELDEKNNENDVEKGFLVEKKKKSSLNKEYEIDNREGSNKEDNRKESIQSISSLSLSSRIKYYLLNISFYIKNFILKIINPSYYLTLGSGFISNIGEKLVKSKKIHEISLSKTGNTLNNHEISSFERKNLIPQEYLEDNIANFPPYIEYKSNIESQSIYKRFDIYDNYHICEKCIEIKYNKQNQQLNNNNKTICSSVFRHVDKTRIVLLCLEENLNFERFRKEVIKFRKTQRELLSEDSKSSQSKEEYYGMGIIICHDYDLYIKKLTSDTNFPTYDYKFEDDNDKQSLYDEFIISTSDTSYVQSFIYTIRNLYGESLAFYFAWVSHYIFILKYLALYALLTYIISLFLLVLINNKEERKVYELYSSILFTVIVIIIGKFMDDIWLDKENVLVYKWGMKNFHNKNFDLNDEVDYDNEDYKNKLQTSHISYMNIKINIQSSSLFNFKKLIVWIIFLISLLLIILINLVIFSFQYFFISDLLIKFNSNKTNLIETVFVYFILFLSLFVFLKIRNFFSSIFGFYIRKLTEWERKPNVNSDDNNENLIILRVILFEMVNYYFNLYYTVFIKGNYQDCLFGDCRKEIGFQLNAMFVLFIIEDYISFYLIQNKIQKQLENEDLLLNSTFSSYENGYDNINNKQENIKKTEMNRKKESVSPSKYDSFIEKNKIVSNNQRKLDDNEDIFKGRLYKNQYFYNRQLYKSSIFNEYFQILLAFGYLIQFGSASPISFLLGFLHSILARYTDSCRFINLFYINTVNGSKGIGYFKKMIKLMTMFGIFSNTSTLLFADKTFTSLFSLSTRWYILYWIVNFLLIFVFFIKLKFLPTWFEYSEKARIGYMITTMNKREMNDFNEMIKDIEK